MKNTPKVVRAANAVLKRLKKMSRSKLMKLIKNKPLMREDRWLTTKENWCPSYTIATDDDDTIIGRLVKASLMQLHDGQWRILVKGANGFGLERDHLKSEKQDAFITFYNICRMPCIKQSVLTSIGFKHI
jgi:hypothetical protein